MDPWCIKLGDLMNVATMGELHVKLRAAQLGKELFGLARRHGHVGLVRASVVAVVHVHQHCDAILQAVLPNLSKSWRPNVQRAIQ